MRNDTEQSTLLRIVPRIMIIRSTGLEVCFYFSLQLHFTSISSLVALGKYRSVAIKAARSKAAVGSFAWDTMG